MITAVRDALISVLFVWFTFCQAEAAGTDCNNSTLTATRSRKYFTYPGYTDGHDRNIACRWTITAFPGETVQVRIVGSDLEKRVCLRCRPGDLIEVTDGTSVWPTDKLGLFATHSNSRIISRRNSLTISLRPRADGTGGDGFKVQYSSGVFYDNTFPVVELEAGTESQVFEPPALPPYYPNRFEMGWRIKTTSPNGRLRIRVLSSSLTRECSSNYMEASDGYSDNFRSLGRWCKQETPEKLATGSYMFILLTCNSPIGVGFGFSIEYGTYVEATTPASDVSEGGGVSIDVIAGTFTGVIAFVAVTFLVSRIICDRMKMRDLDSVHEEEGLSLEDPHGQIPSTVMAPSAPMMPNTNPTVDPSVPPPTYDDVMMNNTLYNPVKRT
ncbi:CUB domain-containing protein 2-like [Haliotis rubra]|uniref:CUB domain-containing protein 2-like n=1 Tax=Haliotis rubra TaxID=36100 RepID=UPI001EE5F714|nr:CUB domain-containing protein 2-like [Haliotis rubra]